LRPNRFTVSDPHSDLTAIGDRPFTVCGDASAAVLSFLRTGGFEDQPTTKNKNRQEENRLSHRLSSCHY
jgi:hypothetical protein